MQITGTTKSGWGTTTTQSTDRGNWRLRLANALSVRGFATVDLRATNPTPFVSLSSALDRAESEYQTVTTPAWQAIGRHLLTLKVIGVDSIALHADNQAIRMVGLRVCKDGHFDIQEASSYHWAINQWLTTFRTYLPDLKLSAEEQQRANRAKDWVGKATDNSAVGWAAGKLVETLFKASGAGSFLTVHPLVGPVSQAFQTAWIGSRLTTEHYFGGGIHSAELLWDLSNHAVTAGEEGVLSWNYSPDQNELSNLLANAVDR